MKRETKLCIMCNKNISKPNITAHNKTKVHKLNEKIHNYKNKI